jgi:hypothetical protein
MNDLLADPHWPYVAASYAAALGAAVGMAVWSGLSLRFWARRARQERGS